MASFITYNDLASIPAFDDSAAAPAPVVRFRQRIRDADGVLICSPEYAFGVPGALKNAIDWTVSSGELAGKPLSLITAATGGDKAHAAWLLTFTALSSQPAEGAALLIPFIRSKMDGAGNIKDAATIAAIGNTIHTLMEVIKTSKEETL